MKQIIENLMSGIAAVAILAGLPVLALSQGPRAPRSERPVVVGPRLPVTPVVPPMWGGETSERSIKVDSSVNLSLCVTQGAVKVNGWNRDEVRVYVQDGSKFGFNVRDKGKNGQPNWIKVMGVQPKGKYAGGIDCIWGSDIEIDVPLNATISIEGKETPINIDGVRKASVKIIGGDISIRNVTSAVSAATGRGGVTVEMSTGPMMLETVDGNILVFEVGPSEIGDMFKAKTNSGNISLQDLQHRQVEARSTSGSLLYNGSIRNGGLYKLDTSNGSIGLTLPADSAGQVSATFTSGNFNNNIPMKLETENVTQGPIKTVVGRLGKGGDALIKLTTYSGTINIKKQ